MCDVAIYLCITFKLSHIPVLPQCGLFICRMFFFVCFFLAKTVDETKIVRVQ